MSRLPSPRVVVWLVLCAALLGACSGKPNDELSSELGNSETGQGDATVKQPMDAGEDAGNDAAEDDATVDADIPCIDLDTDGYGPGCAQGLDCDDSDRTVHLTETGYWDRDSDGWGKEAATVCVPEPGALPLNFVRDGGDCFDDIASANPGVTEDSCDDVDSDCDGKVDENMVPKATKCGVGECARTGMTACSAGGSVDSCKPVDPAVAIDADCNGKDDDCDGQVDEDYIPTATTCRTGSCVVSGMILCVNAALVPSCQAPIPAQNDATCDGNDDDCDGAIDEDFAGQSTACGKGECTAGGQTRCDKGQVVDTCQPGKPKPKDTVCDKKDEDCDGDIDEEYASVTTQCGQGACRANGSTSCVNGSVVDSCSAASGGGSDSSCDGIDDDCDGSIDEDYRGRSETCGVGACQRTGTTRCVNGREVSTCAPGTPAANDTSCNGVDDDCSGQVDEDYVAQNTRCGVGACGRTGTTSCVNGAVVDSCRAGSPAANDATCNGVDEDCSGQADEDYVVTRTSCGQGACSATGTKSCSNGREVDSCSEGQAGGSDATCDGIDSDCDGRVDDDYVSRADTCGTGACQRTVQTSCVSGREQRCTPGSATGDDTDCDGIDDDCDGTPDDGYVSQNTSCGVGACAATGRTSCVNGAVVNSCKPGTPASVDNTCNGVDDDCSGQADEDYTPRSTSCGTGACAAAGQTSCVSGRELDSCKAGTPGANDTTCNRVDDNCNGQTDEGYVAQSTSCGRGVCARSGQTMCMSGQVVDSCQPGQPTLASDTTCNNSDEDCDGVNDDNYASTTTTCGVGYCASTGVTQCVNGQVQNTCMPRERRASTDTTCDGVDDDCDGKVDDDYVAHATSCGVGACAAQGTSSCVGGAERANCTPGTPATNDVTCNNVDDDCDGSRDEDYHATISCGTGVCQRSGTQTCSNGQTQSSCTPGQPTAQTDTTCNGTDEDCSGQADEDYVSTRTSCGTGACASTGATSCVGGQVQNSCNPGTPAANDATCDGIDNDCSGQVDEDYVSQRTSCGIGACNRTGSTSCQGGKVQDSCQPGTPAANDATCNNVDDDCSGQVDEDYVALRTACGTGPCARTGATSCVNGSVQNSCVPGTPAANDAMCNGVDDDCNGQVDEDYVPSGTDCSVGICSSQGQLQCLKGQQVDSCQAPSDACDYNAIVCDYEKQTVYYGVTACTRQPCGKSTSIKCDVSASKCDANNMLHGVDQCGKECVVQEPCNPYGKTVCEGSKAADSRGACSGNWCWHENACNTGTPICVQNSTCGRDECGNACGCSDCGSRGCNAKTGTCNVVIITKLTTATVSQLTQGVQTQARAALTSQSSTAQQKTSTGTVSLFTRFFRWLFGIFD